MSLDDEVSDEVLAAIKSYRPRKVVWNWSRFAPFVRSAVIRACPHNERRGRDLMRAGTYHLDYWVNSQGFELTEELWDLDLARTYLESLTGKRSPRTIAVSGSHLRDLITRVRLLRDEPAWRDIDGRSRSTTPYTLSEIPSLFSWASGRSTARAKRTSHALICLGLGFGLTVTEMLAVRPRDFDDRGEAGIWLSLPNRSLPCDSAYDHDVREMLAAHATEARILRQTSLMEVGSFIGSSKRVVHQIHGTPPNLRRLRTTWLARRVSHLSALVIIMRGYGISHANTLQAALAWIPEPSPTATSTVLRTTHTEGTSND